MTGGWTRRSRLALVGGLAGVAHLVVPGRLIATARWGYDRVLAIDLEARENATFRVRLVGLAFLCVSALLARSDQSG